jgi:hypothetical protein
MESTEELCTRILARPSPEEIERRRRVIEEIRQLQVSIVPGTVTEFRRAAREEEVTYGRGRGADS